MPPASMQPTESSRYDRLHRLLQEMGRILPRLTESLQMDTLVPVARWPHLYAQLTTLLDPHMPLLVAICGGANSGKSTLFNTLLGAVMSPVKGEAGSTRRVLIAAHPQTIADEPATNRLFKAFTPPPRPSAQLSEALTPGPALLTTWPKVPSGQVLIDTPDFDTGSADRYTNRQTAKAVLETCHLFIYLVTNATYNNLENTRFVRQMLTEAGMRSAILVYNCSRTFSDRQVTAHLDTVADNIYGGAKDDFVIGCYRTDVSDRVAAGERFMTLRPVRANDPPIEKLLSQLDPRQLKTGQIDSTLSSLQSHVEAVLAAAKTEIDRLSLYSGTINLALSHAVQQALVTLPIERILHRMNQIWLDTSPGHLKFFRSAGNVIGKPARFLMSMFQTGPDARRSKPRQTDAEALKAPLRHDLLAAAADLRAKLLADDIAAETTVGDPQGAELIELKRRIGKAPGGSPPAATAVSRVVSIQATAPKAAVHLRQRMRSGDWTEIAGRIDALAEEILDVVADDALTEELTAMVGDFRRQMNFVQRTRESLFASLNILPATLGVAYILTTGDPVGGSGIYAKLHGLFGMHDLWALISIPATAGLDETGRKDLGTMLAPIAARWLDSRAAFVRRAFESLLTAQVVDGIQTRIDEARDLMQRVGAAKVQIDGLNRPT